jgi:hypothetical protein
MIKERMLEHKKGRKNNGRVEIWENTIDYPHCEFSKLYLMTETLIMFDVLNVGKGYI